MFVLITGSRTLSGRDYLFSVLDHAHSVEPIEHLVLGDCPTGADLFAKEWATERSVPFTVHVADWSIGRKAGPLRNLEMCKHLDSFSGKRVAVAFVDKPLAESRGTSNTMRTLATRFSHIERKVARQPS